MWRDELKTRYLGEEVEVVRVIESPATPDDVDIRFPDGSQLQIRVETHIPDDVHCELEATKIAETQSAMKWYGNIIEGLYSNATEKHIDVDF